LHCPTVLNILNMIGSLPSFLKLFIMRQNILLFVTLCFFTIPLFAQSVAINTDGSAASASSILDIKSISKGLLIPRMTTAQRTAIAGPAKGLMVFDISTNTFWFHNGSAWTQLSTGGNSWNLTGNAGTNPSSNFIGTTDVQPLRFRVNNLWAGEIHPTSGNVFLGLGAGQSNTIGQSNTAVGEHALNANTEGKFNSAYGYYALAANTIGSDNTANGYRTLYSNTTGSNNTANGHSALYSNTTGGNNTANGRSALYSNTTGNNNTGNGPVTLYSNTTGSSNTANGYYALASNTIGNNNTAMGVDALNGNSTASQNTGIGNGALFTQSFSNGGTAWVSGNTAVGYASLYANQPTSTLEGINNTAVGNLALTANTTGWDNTGIGVTALYTNTGGYENTATGRQSLFYNTIGKDNTASGYKALRNNSTGEQNSANGVYALYSNTDGVYNTSSGSYALFGNTTGYGNTALGSFADVSTVDLHNATAIGYSAITEASNKVQVGNIDVTSIGGQVGWTSFSDGRYKKNIKEDVKGLSFINSLRPITYTVDINGLNAYYDKGSKYDSAYTKAKASRQSSANEAAKIVHNGFIAQDVEKAAQLIGYNFSGVDKPQTKDGLYGLRYSDFVVPLVKAVQEQQSIIETLQKQVEATKAEIPMQIGKQQLIIEELKKQMAEMKIEMELLKKKN
jgi:trimeric autotransporter adhesin